MNKTEGHRARLRKKFQTDPQSFSDEERLELLLFDIIPRRDTAPLASALMARFGSLKAVVDARIEQLLEIDGVGEATANYIHLLSSAERTLWENPPEESNIPVGTSSSQLNLFDLEDVKEETSKEKEIKPKRKKERKMRVFANDEVANSIKFLPHAANFYTLEEFKQYLNDKLPYNASDTRMRRASYIIERFFPENRINTPFTYFAAHCSQESDLKPSIFYSTLKAEPIAQKIAEELIWPALPLGYVDRDQMRELILQHIPDAKMASQAKILQAITHTFVLCGIAQQKGHILRFKLHKGTLESFLYILTSEFPQPGIYSFDTLYNGPLHRWLLWDREWIRQQLYNLQDFGILTKVSEIDTVRQFTLALDQPKALRRFFEHPERFQKVIREKAESPDSDLEE